MKKKEINSFGWKRELDVFLNDFYFILVWFETKTKYTKLILFFFSFAVEADSRKLILIICNAIH